MRIRTGWARSGLMDVVRPAGADHALATAGMGDNPSAMALFGAIMMALYQRERTGRGSHVKTSLMANGAWANSIYLQAALCGAEPFTPFARTESPNALINPYLCADGRALYLAMINEEGEWRALTCAIERPELNDDPRFRDVTARHENSVELVAILDDAFASRPLEHWRRALDESGITFGVVSTIDDVATDEQMIANGVLPAISGGGPRTVDSPITVEGADKRQPGPAPTLGEHTAEVLESLGYDQETIRSLNERRIVQLKPVAPPLPSD